MTLRITPIEPGFTWEMRNMDKPIVIQKILDVSSIWICPICMTENKTTIIGEETSPTEQDISMFCKMCGADIRKFDLKDLKRAYEEFRANNDPS